MQVCVEGEQPRAEVVGTERDKEVQSVGSDSRLGLRSEGERSQGWLPGPWNPQGASSLWSRTGGGTEWGEVAGC